LAFTYSTSAPFGSVPETSSSETLSSSRGPPCKRPRGHSSVGLLSWGSSMAPSSVMPAASTCPRTCRSASVYPGQPRPGVFRPCRSSRLRRFPPQRTSLQATRSLALCRFVAPCSRPWGSPCFEPSLRPPQCNPKITLRGSARRPFPMAFHPSKRSPPRQPADRQCSPPRGGLRSPIGVPSRRWFRCGPSVLPQRFHVGSSTSRLCSTGESVPPSRRCRPKVLDASLGFWRTRSTRTSRCRRLTFAFTSKSVSEDCPLGRF
jgi:hypothetical protein